VKLEPEDDYEASLLARLAGLDSEPEATELDAWYLRVPETDPF